MSESFHTGLFYSDLFWKLCVFLWDTACVCVCVSGHVSVYLFVCLCVLTSILTGLTKGRRKKKKESEKVPKNTFNSQSARQSWEQILTTAHGGRCEIAHPYAHRSDVLTAWTYNREGETQSSVEIPKWIRLQKYALWKRKGLLWAHGWLENSNTVHIFTWLLKWTNMERI